MIDAMMSVKRQGNSRLDLTRPMNVVWPAPARTMGRGWRSTSTPAGATPLRSDAGIVHGWVAGAGPRRLRDQSIKPLWRRGEEGPELVVTASVCTPVRCLGCRIITLGC